jgi:phage gpG-like protein
MATCRLNPRKNAGLERIRRATSPAIGRALEKIGFEVDKEILKNLSGRVLNVRTGKLRSSWANPGAITQRITGGWRMTIGSDVVYARIHELGGMAGRGHKTRIPRRPYMRPAIISQREKIQQAFRGMFLTIRRMF